MNTQQRISQQRVRHIIDSYRLMGAGDEANGFDAYVSELLSQYPQGLIELALVETLAKNWLTIPMEKGVSFSSSGSRTHLSSGNSKPCTRTTVTIGLTPSQFLANYRVRSSASFFSPDKSCR